jgi:hypothetical protein
MEQEELRKEKKGKTKKTFFYINSFVKCVALKSIDQ